MFAYTEPWDCSNSVANMGDQAGRVTWANALKVAEDHESWLLTPLAPACEAVRCWAEDTGAWYAAEREAWTEVECLALLVQSVAGDLREIGADGMELGELPAEQLARFERDEDVTRTDLVLQDSGAVHGEWYGG
jgi:hypothetical protein